MQLVAVVLRGTHLTLLSALPLSHPSLTSEFVTSKGQLVTHIECMKDGNVLVLSTWDGKVICILQVQPRLATQDGHVDVRPWHSCVVEAINLSDDGRWVAVGTRKRTVHVFAVNPYGRKPDNKSHCRGESRTSQNLEAGVL